MADKPSFNAKVRAWQIILQALEEQELEEAKQRARHAKADDLDPEGDAADEATLASERDDPDTDAGNE
jgi:hypothetical protein